MKQFIITFFVFSIFLFPALLVNAIPDPVSIYRKEIEYTTEDTEETAECIKEGENAPPLLTGSKKCCSGLTPISMTTILEGECKMVLGGGVCSNCGNNNCEQWENECNCPKDCREENIIELEIIESEIIRESNEEKPVPIRIIKLEDEKKMLKTKMAEAETSDKLVVEDSKLFIETKSENKEQIKILPEEASSKAKKALEDKKIIKTQETIQLDKIEIKEKDKKPIYSVKVIKKAKIFFLIPVSIKIETQIDAQTGNLVSIKKPWWSFLAW